MKKSLILSDPKNLQYLLNEIEIMRILNHPNIIKLHEVYESNCHIHLVMDYAEGSNILTHIEEQKMYSEKEASIIMIKILNALDYCHSINIVHRDIKLENIQIE